MKKNIFPLILCTVLLTLLTLTAGGCREISEKPPDSSAKYIVPEADGSFVSPVYTGLTAEERTLYDKILNAAKSFEESADLGSPVPRDTVRKIYRLVYSQEKECFWLSNVFYAPEKEISVLKLSYLYTREAAELMRAELDIAAARIEDGIASGADDFEKICRFHDEIILGCEFSQETAYSGSAYGVLVDGKGQCEGYAAAMSLLCGRAGIPNYTVTGLNRKNETHAWNKVLLDGEWYNVDCTWDDPILQREQPDFIKHDYLLLSDAETEGITHFTDELFSGMPACEGTNKNYFVQKGLVYNTAAEATDAIREQIKTAGLAGKRETELRLSSEGEYYAALARLIDNREIKKIIEDINGEYGTKIRSAYQHNNDNLYIIHFSLIYKSEQNAENN